MRYFGFRFRGWRQRSTTLWAVFARRWPQTRRCSSANRPSRRSRRWRSDSVVWSPAFLHTYRSPKGWLCLGEMRGWVPCRVSPPDRTLSLDTVRDTVLFLAVRFGYFMERTIFFYYTNTGTLAPWLYCFKLPGTLDIKFFISLLYNIFISPIVYLTVELGALVFAWLHRKSMPLQALICNKMKGVATVTRKLVIKGQGCQEGQGGRS